MAKHIVASCGRVIFKISMILRMVAGSQKYLTSSKLLIMHLFSVLKYIFEIILVKVILTIVKIFNSYVMYKSSYGRIVVNIMLE